MRAVKNNLPTPSGKLENQKALARANGTSQRASGWAGEKIERSGRPSTPPSRENIEERGSSGGGQVSSLLAERAR
jgi:hypothetical protein